MKTEASLCWNFLLFLWAFLNSSVHKLGLSYEIQVPENYTALGGDLEVVVVGLLRTVSEDVRLELLELEYVASAQRKERAAATPLPHALVKFIDTRNLTHPRNLSALMGPESLSRVYEGVENIPQVPVERKWTVLGSVALPYNDSGGTRATFPCGVISRGGHFGVRLTGYDIHRNNLTRRHRKFKLEGGSKEEEESNLSIVGLDVRWPPSILSISPRHVETYPDVAVTALLQFLPTKCSPVKGAPVPETWLDLLFCGHFVVGCVDGNATHRQVVYSEQVRGYPRRKVVPLKCELFGSAGHFALALRSSVHAGSFIETDNKEAYLKAVWSEHYIFNVHSRSIFPCDVHGGGVPVLFQYPRCILRGDRVRLFSRLRAEVSSLAPPTSLHYVTEQRVLKGKHSLRFDCDFFTEKYVEYCFVYVSQAITGAVSDVRMDCVPTLPIQDSDSGNWGAWNEWSPCTTTCGGGTRNRFRYCDSPPPKYGAKFCQGASVETERCGNADWDCEFYQSYSSDRGSAEFPANRPEVVAEVGPGCRCGCVIHLGAAKPRRLLATSSQSCPGRIFWQIEADRDHVIRFSVEHFRFPCGSQWLKVRDGDSRSSTLIGELSRTQATSVPIISSGSKLLIEYFSDELLAGGQECWGGFLAHAQQSPRPFSNASSISSGFSISNILRNMEVAPTATTSLFLVHCFVALFICVVLLVSGCLGIQYVLRYRKYQLAAAAEDAESAADGSQSSLVATRSRATSNSTLLSEVISLQRFKPSSKYKHSRLREEEPEMEEEQLSESSDSQSEDNHKTTGGSVKTLKAETEESSRKSVSPSPEECSRKEASPDSTSLEGKERTPCLLGTRRRSLSSSSTRSESTLTNECYSPASTTRRTRVRNPKARKERRNLEKLLAGSEFSLPDDGDLELDYYDYDVQNASAVPNSYIGMDPAYLVWIPPFSPVNWDEEVETSMSKDHEEEISNEETVTKWRDDSEESATRGNPELKKDVDVSKPEEKWRENSDSEKETRVEKSPSEGSDYYRIMEDIKYVDDDEEELKCDIRGMKALRKESNQLKV